VQIVSADAGAAERILADMELSDSMNKLPKELSGGMQRRAAIARALAFGGTPLLLDEPFKGLDPDMRERIAKKILEYAGGSAILLITHDEREAELLECDEIIRLA
jgi:ABC-type nitrate/sulfonate/bicarbonate transport system ATPase subunit